MLRNRILIGWTILLAAAHLWVHNFLLRGLLVICGDSDLYLLLSQNLSVPASDRPNGYPFLLVLLAKLSGPFFIQALAFAVHGLAIFAGYRWVKTLKEGPGFWPALVVASIAQFFPLFLFQHSALLMPDSVALSLWILLMCSLFQREPGKSYLALAFCAGLLALLKNGSLALSLVTGIYLGVQLWRAERRLWAGSALLLVIAPFLLYHHLYHRPGVGALNYGYIGGRTALARILKRSSCAEAAEIPSTPDERALLKFHCREEEKPEEYELIWDREALLGRIDAASGQTFAQRNEVYEAWARRAFLLYPQKALVAAIQNFDESIHYPVSYNFRMQQDPALGPRCQRFPATLWGIGVDQFTQERAEYQRENLATIIAFDRVMSKMMPVISLLALTLLLWPYARGLRQFRNQPVLLLFYALALTQLTLNSFGVYYFTRHHLFFCVLSLFQFSVYAARMPRKSVC